MQLARVVRQRACGRSHALSHLFPCASRWYCTKNKPPGLASATLSESTGMVSTESSKPLDGTDAQTNEVSTLSTSRERAPGGLALQEEDNLPPLAFEPGVVGAAQKGISAVVIAFGAAAFGAIAWGMSQALFPSASSTQTIFSEAFEKVRVDGNANYVLGAPIRGFGADHGDSRGRRNALERWEVEEEGLELSVVRFNVAGPQGLGRVHVQVPRKRKRGEFHYIIFEHKRRMYYLLDERASLSAAASNTQPVVISDGGSEPPSTPPTNAATTAL
mmetsp:Transcript_36597/g.60618  ORF Transcript_36597/g.60618 Transcript_36597/m.60618 type:complete len:274 (+) Transcript_36597:85-906(+)